jgi:hypothetical protein
MPDDATPNLRPLCPYCRSASVEPLSLFGQQLLTVQMYCQSCHTPFEYVKDDVLHAFTKEFILKVKPPGRQVWRDHRERRSARDER